MRNPCPDRTDPDSSAQGTRNLWTPFEDTSSEILCEFVIIEAPRTRGWNGGQGDQVPSGLHHYRRLDVRYWAAG